MKRIIYYFKKDIVLTVSWGLAAASAFLVRPDKGYAGYIFRVLTRSACQIFSKMPLFM